MPHVTDHARVRYLERVKGIDMEALDCEILSPAVDVALEFGAPFVIHASGARLCVRDGCVQTVLTKRGRGR